MSKKRGKRKSNQKATPLKEGKSNDSTAAKPLDTIEVITSLWVLSLIFLTVGNLIMAVGSWLAYSYPDWTSVVALFRVSTFGNLVISIVSIILLSTVLRKRPVAPPRAVTIYGVVFCLIPIATTIYILIS